MSASLLNQVAPPVFITTILSIALVTLAATQLPMLWAHVPNVRFRWAFVIIIRAVGSLFLVSASAAATLSLTVAMIGIASGKELIGLWMVSLSLLLWPLGLTIIWTVVFPFLVVSRNIEQELTSEAQKAIEFE